MYTSTWTAHRLDKKKYTPLQLALILSLHRTLEEDRATPHETRLQRDRAVGQAETDAAPLQQVLHWWVCVGQTLADEDPASARVDAALQLAVAGLVIAGLLLGAGVAGTAFAYDGRFPVNLFALLGVLVALPALPLLATGILLLAPVPGIRTLQEAVSAFSPGRWLAGFLHRRLGVDVLRWRGGNAAAAQLAQLEALRLSQWFGIGFFLGALILALLLVAFTDLAFGWSTTLELEAGLVHRIFDALALPWSGWLPAAVPDAELVSASRYYRLEDAVPPDVSRLGAWWPFVCMTLLVYGLLPRVVILLWVAWRRQVAGRRLLLDHPQVRALIDRMTSPLVQHEAPVVAGANEPAGTPAPGATLSPGGANVLIWNKAVDAGSCAGWLQQQFAIEVGAIIELGTYQSRREMGAVLEAMERSHERLVLVTKGWEPPLLEFLDLIEDLRNRWGDAVSITVVPVATSGRDVKAEQRDLWATTLAQRGDGALYVVEATTEAVPA